MKIGYIRQIDTKLNPGKNKFEFAEATFTRKVNSRGDKVYSKLLLYPVDYEDIIEAAEMMKNSDVIIVREPFLLDAELKEKVTRWVNWANTVDEKCYDPFCNGEA